MNPNAVVAQYFPQDDFMFTYNAPSTLTQADEGKAVAIDTAAANTVKLAASGDAVYGRIFKVEDRRQQGGGVVCTVERKFRAKLPIATGLTGVAAVAIGDTVVGNGAGEVRCSNNTTAKTPNHLDNVVIALDGAFAVVEKF